MREPEATFLTAAGGRHLLDKLSKRGETHLVPIVELLAKGVAITFVAQRWAVGKMRFPAPPKQRVWIVHVGDDLFTAEGPAGFHLRSLRKLLERAHAVYVLVGAAVPEIYKAAADVADSGLNVIIIETQTSEEAVWSDFVCRHADRAVKTLVTPNAVEPIRQRNAA